MMLFTQLSGHLASVVTRQYITVAFLCVSPGPPDTTQTDSQNLTVTLSRVYRNGWTHEVTKYSTFIRFSRGVTWLHAGNQISSLENNVQNIRKHNEVKTFLSFYSCCEAPTEQMSALFVYKICELPRHSPINSHFQRKWD